MISNRSRVTRFKIAERAAKLQPNRLNLLKMSVEISSEIAISNRCDFKSQTVGFQIASDLGISVRARNHGLPNCIWTVSETHPTQEFMCSLSEGSRNYRLPQTVNVRMGREREGPPDFPMIPDSVAEFAGPFSPSTVLGSVTTSAPHSL